MQNPTNTERLIADLEHAEKYGHGLVDFMTGKNTGNGPSVVAALRRRGFQVVRSGSGYRLSRAASQAQP